MHFKKFFFIIAFSLFFVDLFSQNYDNEDVPKIFYRNERTISLNLTTNGWGLGYRYGNRINFFEKRIYEFDFSIIKHSKEVKSSSVLFDSDSFVFGKLNNVFDFRFGIGKQNEIFSKRDPGSVSVKYFYTIGPCIALKKPIYYEIINYVSDTISAITEEKFNAKIHTSGDIKGKASFFTGFDELKIVPGAYIKAGFNFEFSQSETIIHALELGAMFQAYTNSLEIMAVDDNQQFLFTLFVSYRLGKIINAQEISEDYLKKRKKKFRLF